MSPTGRVFLALPARRQVAFPTPSQQITFPEADLTLDSPVSALPPAVLPGATGPLLAVLIPRAGIPGGASRHTIRRSEVSLGRGPGNDIVLDDPSVSEQHATLRLAGGVWMLADLESVNGSWVDGEPVHGQLPLASGSTVRLGTIELVFSPHDRWEDSPAPRRRETLADRVEPFMLDVPTRRSLPPSLVVTLVIVAFVILGVLLLRAG